MIFTFVTCLIADVLLVEKCNVLAAPPLRGCFDVVKTYGLRRIGNFAESARLGVVFLRRSAPAWTRRSAVNVSTDEHDGGGVDCVPPVDRTEANVVDFGRHGKTTRGVQLLTHSHLNR